MLLLRRVRDHTPVSLIVGGGYEIRLRVRVRFLKGWETEHTSDNDGTVARESTAIELYEIAPGVLTSNSVSLFPGQFILNMTVSSKCRKSCP